jgi:DUF4097 and DUF4098 domain-containing protein YvlB
MTSHLSRVILLGAASVTVLAGCGGVGARLTFNDVEKVKVTEIVLTGASGNVNVRTAAVTETTIQRIIHRNSDPGQSYRIDGTVLHIDTDCGSDCTVDYVVEAPAGVAVRGELRSGDIGLTGVGTTDVTVTSGNILIHGATGAVRAKATSGDIDALDTAAATTLESTSGNVRAMNAGGPVIARTTSGDVDVKLTAAASVTARASSGDVTVIVPPGSYQVKADASAGDAAILGLVNDPAAKNVIEVNASSGDATVTAEPAA